MSLNLTSWSGLSTEDKLKRARIRLQKKSPFFSYILLYMGMQESEKVPTMGVDVKGKMTYNKKWVDSLTEEELMGVLCHEVLHIALKHLMRGEGKDRLAFNIANDIVVNTILKKDGFDLPKDGCTPDHNNVFDFMGKWKVEKCDEKSSEEIYDEILPHFPKKKKLKVVGVSDEPMKDGESGGSGIPSDGDEVIIHPGGNGSGDGDIELDTSGLSEAEKQKLKEIMDGQFDSHDYDKSKMKPKNKGGGGTEGEWNKIISEAATCAKQRGKLPAGLERMIDEILDSKVGWRHKLYKYVVDQIIHDYSWSTPGKRGAALGIYLPKPIKESVQIVASIDTSGSIRKEELQEFLSELVDIGNAFPNINLDLIICDADIHETYTLTKDNMDDILSLKMSGGGGTSHIPVYDYVQEHLPEAKVLINFTDLWTEFPSNPEEYMFDTIWVAGKDCMNPKDVPFGEVIKIE